MGNQANDNLTDYDGYSVDLNCDVGESTGSQIVGDDQVLIPLVSSANSACGGHGGDQAHVARAVQIAIEHGVTIGAHPGYPDRENFGRQAMELSSEHLVDTLQQQLGFLSGIVSRFGGEIKYVKPHGALYHRCNVDTVIAKTVVEVSREFDPSLSMMGQAGTEFQRICDQMNVHFIREAFADRRYLKNGSLMPRSQLDAVISDPKDAGLQAVSIVLQAKVAIDSNHEAQVIGDSICVHGDSPSAAEILRTTRDMLIQAGVMIRPSK